MAAHQDVARRRTLALVGASAAGKTSLAEALLWKAGALGAPGSIERGSTVSDWDPLERRWLRSVNSSVLHAEHGGIHIHLVDTPGAQDFLGQSLPALAAVETVVVVVNAATGVEPRGAGMMDVARNRARDRGVGISKIEAPGANRQDVVEQVDVASGKECLPINLPADGGERVLDCSWQRSDAGEAPDFSWVERAHRA